MSRSVKPIRRQKWSGDRFSEALGRRLKSLRDDNDMTQGQTAEALSAKGIPMTWTQLARLEKGQRSLRALSEVAGELADADTNGTYGPLVSDSERACAALDAAEQLLASVGETINPQAAAAINAGATAILRQWLDEQEAGK
ncbi:helix-turn-helix domain-containing protein [Candidatus Mycobacterium methanotrophicum]|uniref:Helix-turn-helix domain-containing protein n=2 Tax=Candidatus Mycobacterium methanotrophicum TaxID=2943498 RepID=A0ABY4QEY8_9MYCO|nr:helix-turn-helix transcriptional regulator [Candidatus Mycobacterium methanotrophicum]UQX09552.1 helix-turn-helix domain-containing protein [Candidatus Mycobacterium methanotrophicum]